MLIRTFAPVRKDVVVPDPHHQESTFRFVQAESSPPVQLPQRLEVEIEIRASLSFCGRAFLFRRWSSERIETHLIRQLDEGTGLGPNLLALRKGAGSEQHNHQRGPHRSAKRMRHNSFLYMLRIQLDDSALGISEEPVKRPVVDRAQRGPSGKIPVAPRGCRKTNPRLM